ncbi:CehA/McbA family metallohydrolase [Hansschlegelia sp.]|uniref:CehA/McbA family metallohydrolase n=1 Tax=Hansschlegelia sp. TaxID=2041892 RepID=UPI002C110C9A|nr:CehA/McbA family metallohydrolase [Hansschlegelia sp.]HVI27932.1 CehA/McbA family metallohydrolase [Hansschlegelia sp.]
MIRGSSGMRAFGARVAGACVVAAPLLLSPAASQLAWSQPFQSAGALSPIVSGISKQPLMVQVDHLLQAMAFVGRPISDADRDALYKAGQLADDEAVAAVQQILDRYAVARVDIDPLRKVTVLPMSGSTEGLTKDGWTTFLVKISNRAGATDALDVDSPQAAMPYDFTRMEVERSVYDDQFTDVMLEHVFHTGVTWGTWGGGYPYKQPPQPEQTGIWPQHGDLSFVPTKDRWAAVSLFQGAPMQKTLSGFPLEYATLQVYSRDEGLKSMTMSFNVGTLRSSGTGSVPYAPGSPGMRGEAQFSFNVGKAVPVTLHVLDEDGKPTAARFTIRDKLGRVYPYRSKRYVPDLFFQNQIYRYDGETVELPAGEYTVETGRGPQYEKYTRTITVKADAPSTETFQYKRWINPRALGYESLDKHVHTAGCLHYNDPTYGIEPKDMLRYATGEDLDVADILIWGPNWYYQKAKYFTGQPDPISTPNNVVTHNLEVSQFPSSAGGHTSGHGIRDIDYPGTKKIEDWPSYTLPVLKWMQSQGALSSYTHSGFGLDVQSADLPNYITPPMDSIGANEYIMTVAHGATDLLGVGNTNFISELNIWYHTLNAGYRAEIAGETDWPCINGENVGRGRSYAKIANPQAAVTYQGILDAIDAGDSYVSDGRSHLMNFKVNGNLPSRKVGTEIKLPAASTVTVTADVAALLPVEPEMIEVLGSSYPMETQATVYQTLPEPKKQRISDLPITGVSWRNIPWWHIERARIGDTRNVLLEVVVNGKPVASKQIVADGQVRPIEFNIPIEQSSWVALRILGASHTNPAFVLVDKKPIRGSKASVEWMIRALQQAYEVKRNGWRPEDYDEATAAYDYAYESFKKILHETSAP